jgi:hypothetical protein
MAIIACDGGLTRLAYRGMVHKFGCSNGKKGFNSNEKDVHTMDGGWLGADCDVVGCVRAGLSSIG